MYLDRGSVNFRRKRRNNLNRIALYVVLILIGLYVAQRVRSGEIQPAFIPTPTATRSPMSYAEEGEAHFSSGRLADAVAAYEQATRLAPTNVEYWINLARFQVYAEQPEKAVETADIAVLIDRENSMAHAVRALALDWAGDYEEATNAAVRAIQLDANNALAHAYYAEVLTDTQRWAQAGDEAQLALSLNPNSMDVQRTYGYYLENVGAYEDAIRAYQAAATINPNLAFLYMRLGLNYRVLQQYDTALEYFQRASALDPKDVLPYLSISRTYFQVGEYGRSAQYLESALELEPENPDIYGRLGLVYFRALNYEGAEIELECAVKGCQHPERGTVVEPLSLDQGTLEYFYTYASVKAAYLKCDEAIPVLNQVAAFAQDDEIVQGIVEENRNICARAEAPGAALPEGTVEGAATAVAGTPDANAPQSATAAPPPLQGTPTP